MCTVRLVFGISFNLDFGFDFVFDFVFEVVVDKSRADVSNEFLDLDKSSI